MTKLTKTSVERLPLPETGYSIHLDSELKGFGVRITPTGVKTFYLEKRIDGKPRRIKIGRFGDLTAEQARKEALKLAGEIAKGGNPVAEKARKRMEAKTLREVFEDYVEAKTLKETTVKDMRRALNEVFSDWQSKPLSRISGAMIEARHKSHGERSQARANLAMRYLRALFNFAMARYRSGDQAIIKANPVTEIFNRQNRSYYRVSRRQTVIKSHELGAWVRAVLDLPGEDIRDYFMTVLLTGLRREEALNLTWANLDLAGETLTVIDPKNRRDHTLPLSDFLVDLFKHRHQITKSDFVFADQDGRRISNFRYAQAAVERTSGVSFCIHDLRRTFATLAESLDIPAYALKRLLNHSDGSDVTAGYIVTSIDRLRAPMQLITDHILTAAGLKERKASPRLSEPR